MVQFTHFDHASQITVEVKITGPNIGDTVDWKDVAALRGALLGLPECTCEAHGEVCSDPTMN